MLESLLSLLRAHWPVVLIAVSAGYFLKNYFNKGLNRFPGPIIARFTDWWGFFDVLGRRPDVTHLKLHRQHGDVVRLAPNKLSFASPSALKTIYGLNKGMIKVGHRGIGELPH
jgi:hypothetical protein